MHVHFCFERYIRHLPGSLQIIDGSSIDCIILLKSVENSLSDTFVNTLTAFEKAILPFY